MSSKQSILFGWIPDERVEDFREFTIHDSGIELVFLYAQECLDYLHDATKHKLFSKKQAKELRRDKFQVILVNRSYTLIIKKNDFNLYIDEAKKYYAEHTAEETLELMRSLKDDMQVLLSRFENAPNQERSMHYFNEFGNETAKFLALMVMLVQDTKVRDI